MDVPMDKLEALRTAITLAGGQSAMAEKLTRSARKLGLIPMNKNISQQSVYNWLTRQQQSPSKYARLISDTVNGKVTANQLRPDLYPQSDSQLTSQ
jgi:DNA-binding transcriptional regulator YdaS (Cro superfamily)